jgi:hypothetical protein
MEFPTEDARKKYLKEHPGANPSKHTVQKSKSPGGGGKPVSLYQSIQMHDRRENLKTPSGRWKEKRKEIEEKQPTKADYNWVNKVIKEGDNDRDFEIENAKVRAKEITRYEKAYAYAQAARDHNYHDVAEVLFERAEDLFYEEDDKKPIMPKDIGGGGERRERSTIPKSKGLPKKPAAPKPSVRKDSPVVPGFKPNYFTANTGNVAKALDRWTEDAGVVEQFKKETSSIYEGLKEGEITKDHIKAMKGVLQDWDGYVKSNAKAADPARTKGVRDYLKRTMGMLDRFSD